MEVRGCERAVRHGRRRRLPAVHREGAPGDARCHPDDRLGDTWDLRGAGAARRESHRTPTRGSSPPAGPPRHDYDKSANWKYCAEIYKKYTGKAAPDAETRCPDRTARPSTRTAASSTPCRSLTLFHDIATRVGKYLNAANWVATVDSFGPVVDRGGGTYASLGKGKYDIADTFDLQSFDPSIPPSGNWKALTPYQNIPG